MRNTFGNALTITLFGESHGAAVGAVLDGLAPGTVIDEEYIKARMDKRRAYGKISTARQEADEVEILSGVFEGRATGTPLTLLIRNADARSGAYSELKNVARPSHADYTANCKYGGFQDYRGGGHFSGRITAALVAAGAIVQHELEEKGIYIGTHIASCHGINDRGFEGLCPAGQESLRMSHGFENFKDTLMRDIEYLRDEKFPVLDKAAAEAIRTEIEKAAGEGDSVGGILETAIAGLPAGLGEPWFDTLEGMLAHIAFSVPAVKGIEFGAGFGFAEMRGSEANDAFSYENGEVVTLTNNNGGINGGISNGMPVVFRTAVKPTPSIFKTQQTIDLAEKKNTELSLKGRHDPAVIHRAAAVMDAVTALAAADMLAMRAQSAASAGSGLKTL